MQIFINQTGYTYIITYIHISIYIHFKAVLSLASVASAQLVAYPNGAVAPFDPNNAAATKVSRKY